MILISPLRLSGNINVHSRKVFFVTFRKMCPKHQKQKMFLNLLKIFSIYSKIDLEKVIHGIQAFTGLRQMQLNFSRIKISIIIALVKHTFKSPVRSTK